MYQSDKLRSQPPDSAKDSELRVLPFRGISEPALESALNELVQRLQDAIRTENSASLQPSEEPQPMLPVPPSILPEIMIESPRGEAEPSGEGRDVRPSPGICDPAFESLLHELVQRSQDAFRTENSDSPHSSEESQPPLPIPPNLLPDARTESPRGESELSGEGRDLIMPLLTVLVVGLAMILGVLLGMHRARNRGEGRGLNQSESAGSLSTVSAPLSGQSVTDEIRLGNPPDRTDASQPIELQDKHQKALSHLNPPGVLTVYENDRVIFRLPPTQVSEWERMEHVKPTEVGH
jgi:hypothetical protein